MVKRPPLKNVTPKAGAATRSQKPKDYQPPFRSDKPQPRSKGGRGNEHVTNDDVRRVAEQPLTAEAEANRWSRIDNAIEYLRRYIEHLETRAQNKDKKLDAQSALRLMDEAFAIKEKLGEKLKTPAERIYDMLRFTVVPEIFTDSDITALTLDGIGRCNIMDDITVTMVGDNKEEQTASRKALIEWLVAHEMEDLVTETVNAQTLTAFVRRQLKDKDGIPLPYELIKVNPVTRAQITRS